MKLQQHRFLKLTCLIFGGENSDQKGPQLTQIRFFKCYEGLMLRIFLIFYVKLQEHQGLKLTEWLFLGNVVLGFLGQK